MTPFHSVRLVERVRPGEPDAKRTAVVINWVEVDGNPMHLALEPYSYRTQTVEQWFAAQSKSVEVTVGPNDLTIVNLAIVASDVFIGQEVMEE